jgi:hypothetical protein
MASMVQLSRDNLEAEKCKNSILKRTLDTMMLQTALQAFQDDDEVKQELRSKLLELLDM